MATRVYRVNPGESIKDVTEAAGAATTKLVEVTVDFNTTGVGGTRRIERSEVIEALKEIEAYMLQATTWPPV